MEHEIIHRDETDWTQSMLKPFDRLLVTWKKHQMPPQYEITVILQGWVWSLASDGEHRPQLLCSGAWDNQIKVWDVTVGKEVVNIK